MCVHHIPCSLFLLYIKEKVGVAMSLVVVGGDPCAFCPQRKKKYVKKSHANQTICPKVSYIVHTADREKGIPKTFIYFFFLCPEGYVKSDQWP
jgi:hypothetical protein